MDWRAERAGLGVLVWTEERPVWTGECLIWTGEHPRVDWEHWCGLLSSGG